MLIACITLIIGFIALSWAADRLITGAAALAQNLNVQPLLIGLTVVALGTSAPEIIVAITASLKGNAGLAIGNALGSNIANLGLVLGLVALMSPLQINSQILRREYPILFLIMIICALLLADQSLSQVDGAILLMLFLAFLTWLVCVTLYSKKDEPMEQEFLNELPAHLPNHVALFWLILGITLLPIASNVLVHGATSLAKLLGISDTIIGLSVIAIGTSLPELAAAIAGALKKEHDIVLGNVVGSNIFNLLTVLPIPGLLAPGPTTSIHLWREIGVMFLVTILPYVFAHRLMGKNTISRYQGGLLLGIYMLYLGGLYHHLFLPPMF